jgi:hypothetical protein
MWFPLCLQCKRIGNHSVHCYDKQLQRLLCRKKFDDIIRHDIMPHIICPDPKESLETNDISIAVPNALKITNISKTKVP